MKTKQQRINKPPVGVRCERTFTMEVREIDEKERKVHVSFSSEKPVSRFFGAEILCHDSNCVDLQRLSEIGVSLFNHNRDVVIGKPINIELNEQEKRCHADLIFDDDEDGDKIFRKVQKGFLRGISVGYSVECWEEVKAGATSSNGRFTGPAYVATKWTPLEVSIVSVPADSDVGVNREFEDNNQQQQVSGNNVQEQRTEREFKMDKLCRQLGLDYNQLIERGFNDEQIKAMCSSIQKARAAEEEEQDKNKDKQKDGKKNADEEDGKKDEGKKSMNEQEIRSAEIARSAEISSLCRDFGEDATPYIKGNNSVDEVRSIILNKIKTERAAVPSSNIQFVGESENEKFRAAVTDGLLLRGGISVAKPDESANQFRGMTLRDLAIECLERSGVSNARRLEQDDLFRRAVTADSQFTSILDNTVKKTMATAYKAASTTFEAWTSEGSNPDFKPTKRYQISEAGELVKMTQQGEFKFDEMKDNGVVSEIATFGRAFGFTRQALINDDLGILTKIPQAYVRAAMRGRNKLVYKALCGTDNIYDGKPLFDTKHANISTAGALSTTTLSEMRKLMRTQKNIRGKETLNITPEFLIVPAALEMTAAQLLKSVSDPSQNNPNVVNIYQNAMKLIVDAELDGYSETAFYAAANPADVDTIEVTYLNGDKQPKLESQVGFDFLGIKWRIYDDFGVTVGDYRGLAKNAGA